MNDFNLRKYLKNNPLLKENIDLGTRIHKSSRNVAGRGNQQDIYQIPGTEKYEKIYMEMDYEELVKEKERLEKSSDTSRKARQEMGGLLAAMEEKRIEDPLLKENVGGDVEIEFQNWLDTMSTKFEDENITLQTVIDYAQNTLQDYGMDDWQPGQPLPENKKPLNEFMNSLPVPFDKTDGEPFDGIFLSNDSGKTGIFITNDPEFDYGNFESVGDYYEIAGFKVLEVF